MARSRACFGRPFVVVNTACVRARSCSQSLLCCFLWSIKAWGYSLGYCWCPCYETRRDESQCRFERRERVGGLCKMEEKTRACFRKATQNMGQASDKRVVLRRRKSSPFLTLGWAVLTLRNPRQQSGQEHICNIYESINKLRRKCNTITVVHAVVANCGLY